MVIFSTINMSRSRATFSSLHLDPPSCAISDFCGPNNTIVLTRTLYNPSHERRYHQYWCIVLRILLIANETVMRSIDIDSYICLASFVKKFSAFDECSISATTIEDHLKKLPWPSANVLSSTPPFLTIWRSFLRFRCLFLQYAHHWRSFEEASLAIGDCASTSTTILGHLKKFSSPSVFVPSAPPPLKITWRSFLGHRRMCYH